MKLNYYKKNQEVSVQQVPYRDPAMRFVAHLPGIWDRRPPVGGN